MINFNLQDDEVVLYQGDVKCENFLERLKVYLTSQKIILQQEENENNFQTVVEMPLSTIKTYNNKPIIKHDKENVEIQSTVSNLILKFSDKSVAKKFTVDALNALTGTTSLTRITTAIGKTVNIVEEKTGINLKETLTGLLPRGIKLSKKNKNND